MIVSLNLEKMKQIKKLSLISLNELAKTMEVIPEFEQRMYWGQYHDDCFWRCVAYNASGGMHYSESDAAIYAEQFWTNYYGNYGQAMNHLSEKGGDMSPWDAYDYYFYNNNSINVDNIYVTNFGFRGNIIHAVIFTGTSIVNGKIQYNYFDPTNNYPITSDEPFLKLYG